MYQELCKSTYDASSEDYITRHLKDLSARIINTINDKDFDEPIWKYLTPDFMDDYEFRQILCREEFLKELRTVASSTPDFHLDILNSSAQVDMDAGSATVWLWIRITGLPDKLTR